jgi:hypothetical protein
MSSAKWFSKSRDRLKPVLGAQGTQPAPPHAPLSLARSATGAVVAGSCAVAVAGFVAGAVRLLPWLLDPRVPWTVAEPFTRTLAALVAESALLVGWPLGWALACVPFAPTSWPNGLGESPKSALARLAPQGIAFTVLLMGASFAWGRHTRAPGEVANELLRRARSSCAASPVPVGYEVPFTKLTWLCAKDREPRLIGSLDHAAFSARFAKLSPDFRSVDLEDARVRLADADRTTAPVVVRVSSLTLRGMAPWAHTALLSASARALVLATTAWIDALASAGAVLWGAARTRLAAFFLALSGSLSALWLMRLLERSALHAASFALVPVASGAIVLVVSGAVARLHGRDRTARE